MMPSSTCPSAITLIRVLDLTDCVLANVAFATISYCLSILFRLDSSLLGGFCFLCLLCCGRLLGGNLVVLNP